VEFLQAQRNIHSVRGNKEGLNTFCLDRTENTEHGTVSYAVCHCLWIVVSSDSKVISVNMPRQVEGGFITETILPVTSF
jgi:hypothetical protein